MKLAERLTQNTGMQDPLQSAVQESARPHVAFCQWMGAEMSKHDEHLWSLFQREAFDLVTHYRDLQTQQPAPPPPPPAVQLPPMPLQPQPQPHQPRPWSVPLQSSPPFQQQITPAWQLGPSEFQHHGWPTFLPNLFSLNTSGLSGIFDQTATLPGQMSSTLTTPDNLRPCSQASRTGDRPSMSDVMRTAQSTLEPDQE